MLGIDRVIFAAVLTILCMGGALAQTSNGEFLAQKHCAMCHAIRGSGRSPEPRAPPFPSLDEGQTDALEERLVKGFMPGHPEMPNFRMAQHDAVALVRYLRSLKSH